METKIWQIPIVEPPVTAWRDAWGALRLMPGMFFAAWFLLLLLNVADTFVSYAASFGFAKIAVRFIFVLIEVVALAPLLLAIQRHVLLNETTPIYSLVPSDHRFMRFAIFSAVFEAIRQLGIPFVALMLTPFLLLRYLWLASFNATIFFIVAGSVILFLVSSVVCLRVLILFPAIAIDAPAATWRNAWRESRGHFWEILITILLTGLPLGILILLRSWLLPPRLIDMPVTLGIWLVIRTTAEVLTAAALAAAASRLYRICTNPPTRQPTLEAIVS